MGIPAKNYPKVAYVVIDFILMIISIILMFTLSYALEKCIDGNGDEHDCLGIGAGIRASFTVFAFHFLILLFMGCKG